MGTAPAGIAMAIAPMEPMNVKVAKRIGHLACTTLLSSTAGPFENSLPDVR